jgi:hypothetical protein
VVSDQASWETMFHALDSIATEANRRLGEGDRTLYEAIYAHCPAALVHTEWFDPDPWRDATG